MALNIPNDEVDQLAERLALRQRISKTDAMMRALRNELRRLDEVTPLRDRLRPFKRTDVRAVEV